MNPISNRDYSTRGRRYVSGPVTSPIPIATNAVGQIKSVKPQMAKAEAVGGAAVFASAIMPRAQDSESSRNGSQGFLLTDLAFRPLYANAVVTSILLHNDQQRATSADAAIAERIRTILGAQRYRA